MGHPFSTPSYLGGGHGNEGGLPASEASPLAWLHGLFSLSCFRLAVAIRVQKHAVQAWSGLRPGQFGGWVI